MRRTRQTRRGNRHPEELPHHILLLLHQLLPNGSWGLSGQRLLWVYPPAPPFRTHLTPIKVASFFLTNHTIFKVVNSWPHVESRKKSFFLSTGLPTHPPPIFPLHCPLRNKYIIEIFP